MPNFSSIRDQVSPEKIFQPLIQFLKVINDYMYLFFQYGNLILFLSFLIMGIVLLINAREIEYDEKIHTKNEMVKRRGRIGAAIYIILAFFFLFGLLTRGLFKIFRILPEPNIIIGYLGNEFTSITSLKETTTLSIHETSIFFLVNFISFASLLLLSIGIYLMLFNKFIIHSKLKFSIFLFLGVFFWTLVGFKTSLQLLV